MNKFSFRFVSGVEAKHTLKAEPIPNFFKGDFVVVASCIFRHMGVGVVTSGIIQVLPKSMRDEYSPFIMSAGIITGNAKNARTNKTPVKIRTVSQKSFRADFLFSPVSFFIKTPKSLVNNLSLFALSEP